MRIALVLAVVLVLTTCAGCATLTKLDDRIDLKTFGTDFDDLCVAGRIKGDSARWLNSNQGAWKIHADTPGPGSPPRSRRATGCSTATTAR